MKKLILIPAALVIAVVLFFMVRVKHEVESEKSVSAKVEENIVSDADVKKEAQTDAVDTPSSTIFKKIAEQAWLKIPKKSELQKLSSEEVHQAPKAMREAALVLGDMAQLIHDKPEYQREGFEFYEKCAHESEYPMSIRAICLSGYRKMAKALGSETKEDNVPQQVRALTNRIDN